ncbi:carboxypeptidase-like regulatory domain-containing protein [Algoriphagus sp. NG3]|uniref:carboxypeptidase-like regulatory domain-containing protein n=1 Tax=Algoriphagus sp. NG3 TaxID=3097546 RepID=UPI002A805F4E|nr:carboxypeptidase-like regulatory domain-containing protein [Algoriphagus sp. NG3]WPR74348.1 carboxypeptidase-like regulatory domain-containing protein [Algoriphagus sp. NG3]
MKNTLIDSHKRNLRRINIGIVFVFCLFLGGLVFSISKLTAAPDTEQLQPDKTVKGLVLSPNKKPIPGAVIKVKNATTGTVADINGNFMIDLKNFEEASVTLQIAMVGYESKDVVVNTSKLPRDLGKITLEEEE